MEPIFTLPYSEFLVANLLSQHFKSNNDYSVYIPLSRQEKGVDLMLLKRNGNFYQGVSFQVKSSRVYFSGLKVNPFGTFFNAFTLYNDVDFFLLCGLFPDGEQKFAWRQVVLLFSKEEMENFMNRLKSSKDGKSESKFYFEFDSGCTNALLTRPKGAEGYEDYSKYLFNTRVSLIEQSFTTLDSRKATFK